MVNFFLQAFQIRRQNNKWFHQNSIATWMRARISSYSFHRFILQISISVPFHRIYFFMDIFAIFIFFVLVDFNFLFYPFCLVPFVHRFAWKCLFLFSIIWNWWWLFFAFCSHTNFPQIFPIQKYPPQQLLAKWRLVHDTCVTKTGATEGTTPHHFQSWSR